MERSKGARFLFLYFFFFFSVQLDTVCSFHASVILAELLLVFVTWMFYFLKLSELTDVLCDPEEQLCFEELSFKKQINGSEFLWCFSLVSQFFMTWLLASKPLRTPYSYLGESCALCWHYPASSRKALGKDWEVEHLKSYLLLSVKCGVGSTTLWLLFNLLFRLCI